MMKAPSHAIRAPQPPAWIGPRSTSVSYVSSPEPRQNFVKEK